MKTLISAVRPVENIHLEIIDNNGARSLSAKVTKVVESKEHVNTYLVMFDNGEKATIVYWKRLCD